MMDEVAQARFNRWHDWENATIASDLHLSERDLERAFARAREELS